MTGLSSRKNANRSTRTERTHQAPTLLKIARSATQVIQPSRRACWVRHNPKNKKRTKANSEENFRLSTAYQHREHLEENNADVPTVRATTKHSGERSTTLVRTIPCLRATCTPVTVSYLEGLRPTPSADGLPLRLNFVHTADTPRAHEASLP